MQDRQDHQKPFSSLGTPVAADIERRRAEDAAFRERWDARAPYREIAWLLIKYRMDHDLTQQQLAERVGTSHSQISRMESGRQKTNLDTLLRVARALDVKVSLGFEATTREGTPERHTVALQP